MTLSQLRRLNTLIILAAEAFDEVNDQLDQITTMDIKTKEDLSLDQDALIVNLSKLNRSAGDFDEMMVDLLQKKSLTPSSVPSLSAV